MTNHCCVECYDMVISKATSIAHRWNTWGSLIIKHLQSSSSARRLLGAVPGVRWHVPRGTPDRRSAASAVCARPASARGAPPRTAPPLAQALHHKTTPHNRSPWLIHPTALGSSTNLPTNPPPGRASTQQHSGLPWRPAPRIFRGTQKFIAFYREMKAQCRRKKSTIQCKYNE